MRSAIIFRIEDTDGRVHEFKPLLLRDGGAGIKSLVQRTLGLTHERFMEVYKDELEAQGLAIVPAEELPVEEVKDQKAGNT